jgi:hypothetical protein
MRFPLLVIPKGYEKAGPGRKPGSQVVASDNEVIEIRQARDPLDMPA